LYAVIPVTLIVAICSIQVNPRFYKSEVITYYLNNNKRPVQKNGQVVESIISC